jgi:hypothetical protein
MSDADIRRLRQDLEVIEQAAGLRLPFGWPDVWLALALAAAGLFLSAWGWVVPVGQAAWGLVPVGLVALASLKRWLGQWRQGVSTRRERIFETVSILTALGGLVVLILWEKWLGLPSSVARGGALFLLGVVFIPVGLSAPGRRPALAVSVSLIPFGLLMPLLSPVHRTVPGGLFVATAGLAGAAIMAWQLRAEGRRHGPAD